MPAGYRIGILSDTHGLLRMDVTEALKGCGAILHGGDINRQEILDQLEQIAPVYAVRGNNDKEWAEHIPETLTVSFGRVTFFMIHNRKMIAREDLDGADVVIYGHSHRYEERCGKLCGESGTGSRLWLNPGSCGPRRFAQPITMAVMEIEENGSCRVERIDLSHKGGILRRRATACRSTSAAGGVWTAGDEASAASEEAEDDAMKLPANIQDLVPLVIKEMKRGRPVAEIAKKTGLSYELTEQICRLYVTHPGVDLDGILRRMGI